MGAREERIGFERAFFKDEYTDHFVYTYLMRKTRNEGLRSLLEEFVKKEEKHMEVWESLLNEENIFPTAPSLVLPRAMAFRSLGRLFGTPFMVKLLERNEENGLGAYEKAHKARVFNARGMRALEWIMRDERVHEKKLLERITSYESNLDYIKAIILGLNDGLVEILAAVAGLAALATGSTVVVIGGIIVGISGTLSMAGGAYLAFKSQNIVSEAVEEDSGKKEEKRTDPLRDAYYTGLFYFLGALVPILPFLFGATSYYGIALSILLDAIVLVIASIVIGVISGTSIKRRIFEMLVISIGAAMITIAVGTFARVYLHIAI